jgi:hypothetical protein
MRALLTARLLLLSPKKAVLVWVKDWRQNAIRGPISDYDRRLLRRLLPVPSGKGR